MEVNDIFAGRYRLEKFLGSGTYSEVWLANDEKTNLKVALKIYALATGLDDNSLKMFAREFSLVADVNSPYVLKPLYFDSDRKPYLVLQYCKNGSIKTLIHNTEEKEAWKIILDVAKGLKELHAHKPNPIVHQDIKPDNILISDEGHYMITDFGVSVHIRSTVSSISLKLAGTRAYMAPERFNNQRLKPIMASDVWSLGATMFEILSGDVPFSENGGLNQESGMVIPELPGDYSETLRKTLEDCLAHDSWKRPTAEQLIKIAESAIENEVFLEIGKEKKNDETLEEEVSQNDSLEIDSSHESTDLKVDDVDNDELNTPSVEFDIVKILSISGLTGAIVGIILGLISYYF